MRDDSRLRVSESALYAAFNPMPVPADRFFDTPSLNHKLGTLLNIATSGAEIGLVKGPDGSGKTTLIRRLDALLETRPGVTFLTMEAAPGIRLPQALGERLGLDADEMGTTPTKRLIEYLRHLRGGGMAVAVAIDDAHHLLPDDLVFLASLSLSPNPTKGGLLHLMLFATAAIDERLKRVSHAVPPERVFDMPISPLSAEQTADYVRHRLRQAGLGEGFVPPPGRLSAIYRRSGGRPAAINLLMRGEREAKQNPLLQLGWPLLAAIAGGLAVLGLGLGLWAFMAADDAPPPTTIAANEPTSVSSTPPPADPPLAADPLPSALPPPASADKADDEPPATIWDDEVVQAPPPAVVPVQEPDVTEVEPSVAQAQTPPPVSIPKTSDDLSNEAPAPPPTDRPSPFADQPVSAAAPTAPAAIKLVSIAEPLAATPALTLKPTLSSTPARGTASDWLLSRPAEEYMIQLLASDDPAKVEQFVATHDFPIQPTILATDNAGARWYVLLLGPYQDQAQANAAANGLPAELKAGKPWLRSVSALTKVAADVDN